MSTRRWSTTPIPGGTRSSCGRRRVYWCTADPGWVTGTSYGIIAPLVHRVTMIVDEAEFDLDRWYSTLQNEKVEIWYSAPTAIRMMMREGAEAAAPYDFSSLKSSWPRSASR
jgi:acetyl-CoA synthetase